MKDRLWRAGGFLFAVVATLLFAPSWAQTIPPTVGTAQEVRVATSITFMEGPTADRSGNIFFSDVIGDRIMRLGTDGKLVTFRMPANIPNGMVMDPEDGLIVCEVGDPNAKLPPRITRIDTKTGSVKVLVDQYEGQRLMSPNDVTLDGKGRIYFTNDLRPPFLAPYPNTPIAGIPDKEVNTVGVYRLEPNGVLRRILQSPQIRRPNGIMVSPDDRTLYVIENDPGPNGLRRLLAFDLADDGTTSNQRVFRDFFPGRSADGMAVDVKGNLYVVAGLNRLRGTTETLDTKAGVYVLSPEGALLRFIAIPEDTPTNITFAGVDMKTIYVTAGKTLFKFENDIAGLPR